MIERLARWTGLLLAGGGLALAVGAALRLAIGFGADRDGVFLGLGLGLLTGGIWMLAAASVMGRPGARLAGTLALAATVVAEACLGALALAAMRDDEPQPWLPAVTGVAAMLALGFLFLAILRGLAPTSDGARAARVVTIGLVWLALASGVTQIVLYDLLPEPFRKLGGSAILVSVLLAALAGATTYHLLAVERRRRMRLGETVSEQILLELECPRCTAPRRAPPGVSTCAACGHALSVAVEEPRCECGYQLFRLEGDTCPECGRPATIPSSAASPRTAQ